MAVAEVVMLVGSLVVEVVVEGSGLVVVRESGWGVVVREVGVEGVSSSKSESDSFIGLSSGRVP